MWYELYNQSNKPTMENISEFVNSKLWYELCKFIEGNYPQTPSIEYSRCSMQKGWNVKYKKGRKSLCTLYPMMGFFIALVVIGERERFGAELLIKNCSEYVQKLYNDTPFACGGKWLMIEVKEQDVLKDVIDLIQLRAR